MSEMNKPDKYNIVCMYLGELLLLGEHTIAQNLAIL